ncbi:MAG: hypothetical protein KC502_23685 [Myxococcales bacterium]|nr:hypothetical protein [Myxococcales bacterium]
MQPSTDWREQIADGETERFDKLAATIADIQKARAQRHPMGRALHYKAHGGLLATFRVLPDLPEWTRVGIFETPAEFPTYVRFSNGSGGFQRDTEPDVRGIAVKLVGVPGKKIIHPDAVTQDFLAILSPSGPFETPEEFVGLVHALSGNKFMALPRLIGTFGFRLGSVLGQLKKGLANQAASMVGPTFNSSLPIKWGDYAVKYSFEPLGFPTSEPVTERNGYRADLHKRLADGPVRFAFRVQGFVSEDKTPIEHYPTEWLEEDAPWVTVGELEIHQQASTEEETDGLAAYIESLVFDTWHAPEAFRPVGALQRARNHAYRDSSITRKAAPEPDGTERWHQTSSPDDSAAEA